MSKDFSECNGEQLLGMLQLREEDYLSARDKRIEAFRLEEKAFQEMEKVKNEILNRLRNAERAK